MTDGAKRWLSWLAVAGSVALVVLGAVGDSMLWIVLGAVGLVNCFVFERWRWRRSPDAPTWS